MNWPGMGDPVKRKKILKFLGISAGVGLVAYLGATLVMIELGKDDPLKVCIDDRITPYKISATFELYVDKQKIHIPADVGVTENCHRSMYTISDDGTIYAEWEEEYPFEIGHFLWIMKFPIRDMVEEESRILVNGVESEQFINHPFQNGFHYKVEFKSKFVEDIEERDFLPPEN